MVDRSRGPISLGWMFRYQFTALGFVVTFASMASSLNASVVDSPKATEITAAIEGVYSNEAQIGALPDGISVEPAIGGDWIDFQYAVFSQVDMAVIEGEALYLQWHSGGASGPISRQRIWTFADGTEPGTVEMRFFTIDEDKLEVVRDSHLEPGRVVDLSESDLIAYPLGCEVIWRATDTGFAGAIEGDCSIVAQRSGRSMKIEAEITISGDALTYREAGVLDDGSYAFLVPGADAYVFERTE